MLKRRRLPHFDHPGQPQFITFRLHGSLPANRAFPAASLNSGEAFVSMDRLLDQAQFGPIFLRQREIAHLVMECIGNGGDLGHYQLHSWVIMPNHVHLLITPSVSLSKLLGALKGVTAKRAGLLLGHAGQRFWQDESYDHLVRSKEEFWRIQGYIEHNPVTAGLAARPEEYEWSSAGRGG